MFADVSCFQLFEVEGSMQVRLVRQRLNGVKHELKHLRVHVLPDSPIEEHLSYELCVTDDGASVVRQTEVKTQTVAFQK